MPNNTPYLCGGIFFDLLLQARKNRAKARDKQNGGTDGLSVKDVMKGLVCVVTGEEVASIGDTFSKATTEYRSCKINGNTYIPFNDTSTIASFDNAVKNKNTDIVKRMSEFIEKFLNFEKSEWLAKALMETILNDTEIEPSEVFFITSNESVKKENFDKITYISLDNFLVSILHFILTKRSENCRGEATFTEWFTRESSRAEWKLTTDVGSSITQNIIVFDSKTNAKYAILGRVSHGKTKRLDALTGAGHVGQFTSVVADMIKPKESLFSKYLEHTKTFYSTVKTLLYSEKPRSFYDFYVCNTLRVYPIPRVGSRLWENEEQIIEEVTVPKIEAYTNCTIIKGTGGIGKSMMMRHLLLSSIEEYPMTDKLPILIPLKNYRSDCDLKTFIYQTVKAADNSILPNQVYDLLETGNCIILLDGLDEVLSSLREKFESELEQLTMQYPENTYIISSRPTSKFLSYGRFTVMQINEFSKEQSLKLIDKLEFHNTETKKKFRKELDNHLFFSHKQFASNPLLLTIMLMTYSSFGDIPGKMHIFYSKAYETMARLHDASKGAYKRPLHSKLSPEDFADYFAEFCARTYRDEVLEFTVQSFCKYMDKVIQHKRVVPGCPTRAFLRDLTDNLCIMYEEGEKYYFIHRSFQEYFSAVFFSNQMDDKLPKIAEQFKELRHKSYHDKTFDMLYDMIPHKIDRFIFTPYLKALWEKCDGADGYWTFLCSMYPTIYSYSGESDEWYENTPEDYFYDFVVNENLIRYNGQLDDLDWPDSTRYFKRDFARIPCYEETAHGIRESTKIVDINSSEFNEFADNMGDYYDPDWSGTIWEIVPGYIMQNKSRFKELIAFMEDDEFPLKKEYNLMREYSEKLFAQYDESKKEIKSDDWFDDL